MSLLAKFSILTRKGSRAIYKGNSCDENLESQELCILVLFCLLEIIMMLSAISIISSYIETRNQDQLSLFPDSTVANAIERYGFVRHMGKPLKTVPKILVLYMDSVHT